MSKKTDTKRIKPVSEKPSVPSFEEIMASDQTAAAATVVSGNPFKVEEKPKDEQRSFFDDDAMGEDMAELRGDMDNLSTDGTTDSFDDEPEEDDGEDEDLFDDPELNPFDDLDDDSDYDDDDEGSYF